MMKLILFGHRSVLENKRSRKIYAALRFGKVKWYPLYPYHVPQSSSPPLWDIYSTMQFSIRIKGRYASVKHFIKSKHGDTDRKEMQVLELITFLPLSNTLLSLPTTYCHFLLFTIFSSPLADGWTGRQGDTRADRHLILLLY